MAKRSWQPLLSLTSDSVTLVANSCKRLVS
jgi:hypothetical protein